MKPKVAAIAWGVTRKLTTHGQVVLISLQRLQRSIQPRTIASAVVAELAKRGILIKVRRVHGLVLPEGSR
jgi:hypothetical protein